MVKLFFVTYLFSWLVYNYFKLPLESLIFCIILTFMVQSFVMFIMLFLPDVQSIYLSLLDSKAKGLGDAESLWRLRQLGVTGWAVYDMAVNLLLAIFLIPACLSGCNVKITPFVWSFIFIILLFASILSARTAFIGFFIFSLISLWLLIFRRSLTGSKVWKIFNFFIFYLLLSIPVFMILYQSGSREVVFLFDWVLEIFSGFTSNGFETKSTNELAELYFVPSENTILFGDGKYIADTGGFYGGTDVGYLRVLLHFGLFGSLIFYFSYLLVFSRVASNFKKLISVESSAYFKAYVVFLFIVQFKGNVMVDSIPALSSIFIIFNYSNLVLKNGDY
ncbi:hypothetical protein LZP69_12880 [Shewanella sp. AS1]|uniref:hypothetical protein n=1 Tax=Shewanella sp. AS1 TaxID=2907626 RepID=UPI001F3FEB53|nr:hypothetical protein [Shewanella sp. AS1]MCE9680058.1 hypothetical protein [Shewanella sp. AS1]